MALLADQVGNPNLLVDDLRRTARIGRRALDGLAFVPATVLGDRLHGRHGNTLGDRAGRLVCLGDGNADVVGLLNLFRVRNLHRVGLLDLLGVGNRHVVGLFDRLGVRNIDHVGLRSEFPGKEPGHSRSRCKNHFRL